MNKILLGSLITFIAVGLVSCTDKVGVPSFERQLRVTVLKQIEANEDTYTVLCIDSVKYLKTAQGGISVKYVIDTEGDPFPESCVNQ